MMPGTYALTVYRGDDYAWRFMLWVDAAKTQPVDLTGMAVKAEVRDKPSGANIVPLAITVTLPNIIDMVLAHAASQQLPLSGRWDLQLTDAAGLVATVLAGAVRVTADITDSTITGRVTEAAPRRAGYVLEVAP